MTLVVDKFKALLPPQARPTPSGWLVFNAVCCHHNGHSQDTRSRAGVRFDLGIVYHCFNCGFTTGWHPGSVFGHKIRELSQWLNASDQEINAMIFEALKTESPDYDSQQDLARNLDFESKTLPENSQPLLDAALAYPQQVLPVIEYLIDRGLDLEKHDFHWSTELPDRAIIPFYYHGKLVGYTARRIRDLKPKYLSDQPSHFVFNLDHQSPERQYVFVTEGPFDALAVDGVALLTNEISEQQARLINNLGQTVIVIPDQDAAGIKVFEKAIELGWSVALPNWEDDIKDVADAVKRYGRLFVTVDCIMTAVAGEIKLKLARQQMEAKLKRLTYE